MGGTLEVDILEVGVDRTRLKVMEGLTGRIQVAGTLAGPSAGKEELYLHDKVVDMDFGEYSTAAAGIYFGKRLAVVGGVAAEVAAEVAAAIAAGLARFAAASEPVGQHE